MTQVLVVRAWRNPGDDTPLAREFVEKRLRRELARLAPIGRAVWPTARCDWSRVTVAGDPRPEVATTAPEVRKPERCHNCGKDAYGGAICCNSCDEDSI